MPFCFFPAVRGEDKRSVIGYVNESVVLSSYVDPSWTLKNIQWTIFKNDTLIATFENNVKRVDRWPQFNGRLELNTTSGDLTINNLTANDSMEYSTQLEGQGTKEPKINKVQLFVRGENCFYLHGQFKNVKYLTAQKVQIIIYLLQITLVN